MHFNEVGGYIICNAQYEKISSQRGKKVRNFQSVLSDNAALRFNNP